MPNVLIDKSGLSFVLKNPKGPKYGHSAKYGFSGDFPFGLGRSMSYMGTEDPLDKFFWLSTNLGSSHLKLCLTQGPQRTGRDPFCATSRYPIKPSALFRVWGLGLP